MHEGILSVADAQPLGDGWIVLDRRTARLHLLGSDLELRRSFGGRGEGPGEMRAPTELAALGDTLVAVVEEATLLLHRFTAAGDFVDRRPIRLAGCRAGIQGDLATLPGGRLLLAGRCSEPTGTRWIALAVADDGVTTPLLERRVSGPGRIDPFVGLGLASVDGRAHLVRPDGCLHPLGTERRSEPSVPSDRTSDPRRCLPAAPPVPIPDSLLESIRASVPARVAERYRLELPEHLPRVLEVAWSPHGAVLQLSGPGGALLTSILRPDGRLQGVTGARSLRPGARHLLTWRTEVEGTAVRVVPWARR